VPEPLNLRAVEPDIVRDRPGFSWRRARVGEALGAALIGGSLYDLEAGQRSFPYHFEHAREEWLLVVDGTPTLRTPDGERELRAGDVVCFPVGETGAHQVIGPGRILMVSTMETPTAAEYPDSAKVNLEGRIFRTQDEADYWDGEGE
jgi:uncharacterized cupin superfamily protein